MASPFREPIEPVTHIPPSTTVAFAVFVGTGAVSTMLRGPESCGSRASNSAAIATDRTKRDCSTRALLPFGVALFGAGLLLEFAALTYNSFDLAVTDAADQIRVYPLTVFAVVINVALGPVGALFPIRVRKSSQSERIVGSRT